MGPDEVSIAVKWAAAEGWNPGLADDACFAAVDPEGFLIGELDGAPAATVSCVNYSASFAFLGFYIVREDLRGRGYGLRIWDAAIAHAGPRVIGLDGVVAQQQNYRKSGFELAYANVRYGGIVASPDALQAGVLALAEVPLTAVETYDATVFSAPRPGRWPTTARSSPKLTICEIFGVLRFSTFSTASTLMRHQRGRGATSARTTLGHFQCANLTRFDTGSRNGRLR